MNPAQLLAHFDRISEAPDAIPRLRRFILDLAVRGKLVEQDPNDEPAGELYKRIQVEKERALRGGRIKKEKPFPEIESDEIPFCLHHNWKWVRIRQITTDRGQTIPSKDFTYIDVTSINKEVGCIAEPKVIAAFEAPSRARKLVFCGDVLYSCVRPYLLNIAIIENDIQPPPIASTAFAVINGLGLVQPRYIWIVLRSPFFVECVEGKMRGQAYPAINDADFSLLLFPLPPLAEQHRIVAKVDELMALCDQWEAERAGREQSRDRLVAATLQKLNQPSEDPETFRADARFAFKNLPRLTARPAHIKQLRQTILNLAVRGKLVEQNPNDVPVTEFLGRVQQEKENLEIKGKATGKKIRTLEKPCHPFQIPNHWSFVRFGDILVSRDGERIPVSKEERNTKAKIYDYYGASGVIDAIDGYLFDKPLLLIGEDGANLINRSTPIAFIGKGKYWVNNHAHVLDGITLEFLRYIELHINAIDLKPYVTGTAQPKMNQAKMNSIPIAVPPEAEQHRIVAKVDELMALCDQLEAQLADSEADRRRLLESVLSRALLPQPEACHH